jgi:hypothetical protein
VIILFNYKQKEIQMKVVAFGGQIANGKDVCADYLVEKLNEELFGGDYNSSMGRIGWERIAFGDGVKKVFMDAFGEDLPFVEEWKRRKEIPNDYLCTVREALQTIGDDFRHIHPDVWVNLVFRKMDMPRMVISDVRYASEAHAVKKHGGINVLVWRPGFENDINHPSEAQIPPYVEYFKNGQDSVAFVDKMQKVLDVDYVPTAFLPDNLFDIFIVNDGSLEDLYNKIDEVVVPYVEKRLC